MQRTACAKINLFLHVLGKNKDNYHRLESLVAFAENVYDQIEITPATATTINISGEFAPKISNDNLILKAHQLLDCPPVKINLTKNIPVSAGLGGGSADAAATVKMLCAMFAISLPDETISALCMKLGSDVLASYHGTACYIESIGEKITPIGAFPKIYALLVNPHKEVSTKAIFQAGFGQYSPSLSIMPAQFHSIEEVINFIMPLKNDLLTNAIHAIPELHHIINTLRETDNCIHAGLSGSGATCFALYKNNNDLQNAYKSLKHNEAWWVKPTALI
jgi:4-diphosphocytidyl-2-C-methyl-D-erythritol kinase